MDKKQTQEEIKNNIGRVVPRSLETEMEESYLSYAMSVIVSRALPDVRDGLKPVHRRILYAMWDIGLKANAKFRKSANVVGEVMAKYHPHGDAAIYDSMVRMAQEFSMRYPLVAGQGNFGCFTKDTKVKLTDGRDLSFEDLVKEHRIGKKNYTYTVNSAGLIAIAEIKNPRMTIRNADLVKVILDNGEEVRCTSNHRFMVRSGSYKEAKDLQSNDSLMPIYQKLSDKRDRLDREGYVLIYQNKKGEWVPSHHLADNYNLTLGGYPKNAGRVRHHIDFNKLNNNPDNITRIHWSDHWKIHYQYASELHKSQEYRKKIAEGRRVFWSNPVNRTRYAISLSERNIKNWKNPDYREKMRRSLSETTGEYIKNHPELRVVFSERASNTLKRLWQDANYRKLFHEKIVAANKKRVTNNTGKVKFLNICKNILDQYGKLDKEIYEQKRNEIYPYGMATSWKTGIEKYYENNLDLVLFELHKNHKVLRVEKIESREDVYDLTIDGSHNFALAAGVFVHNSVDGDSSAAMRYTESKLSSIAEELLFDIEKDTVNFTPNYDDSIKEPTVLPAKIPNLLINGTMGIAVGMATQIPPHNLAEVLDATLYLIANPDASVGDVMNFVQGPDFPTGGIVYGEKDLIQAYTTGKGGVVVRAKTEMAERPDNGTNIIITEIPYQVNKSQLLEKIADLVKDKKIEGIKDLRDESDRDGIRVVVELRKDAYPKKVLNRLFQYTQLQDTFHFNMLALTDAVQPRVLNLKEFLEYFIAHRETVIRRRTAYELNKAEERVHILLGLKTALDNIDAVVRMIKKSKDRDEARLGLQKQFKLSERQANAILDMRLSQLTNLDRSRIEDELKEKRDYIKDLKEILANRKKLFGVMTDELKELRSKYQSERRSKITKQAVGDFTAEDLIPNEPTIVTLTRAGYIKRLPQDTFKVQGRGGKGVKGLETREDDAVEHLIATTTHATMLFFTSRGRVFSLRAYELPMASRTSKGQMAVNFLQMAQDERISAVLPLEEIDVSYKYFVMATAKGLVKKCAIEEFKNIRKSGLIAIRLKPDDQLKWVKPSGGADEAILVSAQGQAIRMSEKQVRAMGRNAAGVRGIRLKGKDEVVGMDIMEKATKAADCQVLVIMANGYGKRTGYGNYRLQGRGGTGIKTAKITPKTGQISAAFIVNAKAMQGEDIIIISEKGQVIRLPFDSISTLGRATQGVRVMKFKEEDDRAASVTFV